MVYKVIAYGSLGRKCWNEYMGEEWGMFTSRAEAERCLTALAGRLDCHRAQILEEEEEEEE